MSTDEGVTLVELVITIVIVGIVFIPIIMGLRGQVEALVSSRDSTIATGLLRAEMERLKNLSYASVTNTTITNYESTAYDMNRAVSITASSAPEELKQVTVSIARPGSSATLASAVTYLVKNVSF